MKCRHCSSLLEHTFLDLGFAPLSNAYLTKDDMVKPEKYYPLKIRVCSICWLAQTEDFAQADELFNPNYSYFSSTSTSWLMHAANYVENITRLLELNQNSFVIEVASNDGYLLKNFVSQGIPCLGIEPTASTAAVAESLGIPVIREFFSEKLGKQLASTGMCADLIAGNNVFAHVPDINDFARGLKAVLKSNGCITLEFPHLLRLIEYNQFDTVYHEHFSYLSLYTVNRIFKTAGLRIYDVEELATHGGSLRIYGCHENDARKSTKILSTILLKEAQRGLQNLETYQKIQLEANRVKNEFLTFLIDKKKAGKRVAAYGAAAKGNTLLNYAGVKQDLIEYVCDAAEAKQGKWLPGSHIPIVPTSMLLEQRPDYLVILPWNIIEEIKLQNTDLVSLGTKFVTAVPNLQII